MTDDMGNGLGVGAAFWAAGGFARVEAGGVFADEGVARDESDYSRWRRHGESRLLHLGWPERYGPM